MAPVPAPSRKSERHRHKRFRSRNLMFIALLISLPVMISIPLAHKHKQEQLRPAQQLKLAATSVASTPLKSDLVLSEAFLEGTGAARRLKGTVRNTSRTPYDGVEVRFQVLDAKRRLAGSVAAEIKAVEPAGSAQFTAPVPEAADVPIVVSITGTPRTPGEGGR